MLLMPIMQTIRRKNKKNAFFQDVNELFYENILFKKMWVMDRVFNFWKVESLDILDPLSKSDILHRFFYKKNVLTRH
jgi:hypothetical protein